MRQLQFTTYSSIFTPPTNSFQLSSSSGFFSNFELLGKDSVKKLVLSIPFHLTLEEIWTAQAFRYRTPSANGRWLTDQSERALYLCYFITFLHFSRHIVLTIALKQPYSKLSYS